MKYVSLLFFTCTTLFCYAQADTDQAYTLDPSTSRIIGGFFAFDGNSVWTENGNNLNNHSINLGPYFSFRRSDKKDILFRTNLLLQTSGDGTPSGNTTRFTASFGIDWRHELYQLDRFKIFGSYGPRLGVNLTTPSNGNGLGYEMAAVGNISLAFDCTPNIRLLTSLARGSVEYKRLEGNFNFFNYGIRNTILSPNFSIEYILPRKA